MHHKSLCIRLYFKSMKFYHPQASVLNSSTPSAALSIKDLQGGTRPFFGPAGALLARRTRAGLPGRCSASTGALDGLKRVRRLREVTGKAVTSRRNNDRVSVLARQQGLSVRSCRGRDTRAGCLAERQPPMVRQVISLQIHRRTCPRIRPGNWENSVPLCP